MSAFGMFLSTGVGLAGEAMAQTAPAGTPGEATGDRLRHLEIRIDKLVLASSALWSLLKEHTPLTDTDVVLRITELDLRDGQLDGRLSPAVTCVKCGKKSSRRHDRCLWCGVFHPTDSPFESV